MTKIEFEAILNEDRELYLGQDINKANQMKKSCHKRYTIWKYLYYFRCCQYWRDVRINSDGNKWERKIAKWKFRYYDKKRNLFSEKSGVEIGIDCRIGRACDIWHSGIVINGNVGDNCTFHGNNIIGNKGKNYEKQNPTLGNNVDVGAGANIIGELYLADGCRVGAGAVVTKSCDIINSVLVGVPAKRIR